MWHLRTSSHWLPVFEHPEQLVRISYRIGPAVVCVCVGVTRWRSGARICGSFGKYLQDLWQCALVVP